MKWLLLIGLLLMGSGGSSGTTTGGASAGARDVVHPSHSQDVWDEEAGFTGGYVYSITQTNDGYIWIGTSKGLVRFGGLTFLPVRPGGPNADSKRAILGVMVDANDQLWATDDNSRLYRYESGHLSAPLPDNGNHRYILTYLDKSATGWLLFVSETQGLIKYERGSRQVLLTPEMMPRLPTGVAQTADGSIWIGTQASGLFRLTQAGGVSGIQHVEAITNSKINCLLPVGTSTLLIGTDKGLLNFSDGQLKEVAPELARADVLALAAGRDGKVWIGSDDRVFSADAANIEKGSSVQSLGSFSVRQPVTALLEDRDGELWIGETGIVERYRASGFTSYLSTAGMPCSNCGAIYADHKDHVWFAPADGGLFQLAQNTVEPVEAGGIEKDIVYTIAEGADGDVWVGRKHGGVTYFHTGTNGEQATTYTPENGLAENSVYSIYRASDGAMWFGTLAGGVSRFQSGKWRTFNMQDGLPSNTISAITGYRDGDIFVGTPNGLAEFKNDRWKIFQAQDGLPPGAITSLFLDSSNILWIGTTKGIAFLQSGSVHVPLGAPNALYESILGIAESGEWLWITTSEHVLRMKRTSLQNQSFGEGDYREFGLLEGLPSTEGVKRNRSVVVDDHGRTWFSLNKGIAALEPTAFSTPAFPVKVRADGFLVDGKSLPTDGRVEVPAGGHRITFRYAGISPTNPDNVRYRYRLDTVDSEWSEPTALREIDYTNVPPGKFQFHVMARNADGIWSDEETAMAFEVRPAYWQTAWFRVGSVLALSALVFALYRIRMRELNRQFEVALDARVDERTRIARELHDTLLQSLHGLMFQFQAARNLLPKRVEEAIETLDSAIGATEQAIAEGRGAIHDLRDDSVRDRDLSESLKATAQELAASRHPGFPAPEFEMVVEGEHKDLLPALQDEVYRIAREILRNAFMHSEATRIEVEVRYDAHALRLRIRDNGRGIDPKILRDGGTSGHWGLRGVRERAQQIGAQLDFWSEVAAGTEVQLNVPAGLAYEHPGTAAERKRAAGGARPTGSTDKKA
jgi:signal transduction histidine kinase/ligand-binding sensor domain-containing protein